MKSIAGLVLAALVIVLEWPTSSSLGLYNVQSANPYSSLFSGLGSGPGLNMYQKNLLNGLGMMMGGMGGSSTMGGFNRGLTYGLNRYNPDLATKQNLGARVANNELRRQYFEEKAASERKSNKNKPLPYEQGTEENDEPKPVTVNLNKKSKNYQLKKLSNKRRFKTNRPSIDEQNVDLNVDNSESKMKVDDSTTFKPTQTISSVEKVDKIEQPKVLKEQSELKEQSKVNEQSDLKEQSEVKEQTELKEQKVEGVIKKLNFRGPARAPYNVGYIHSPLGPIQHPVPAYFAPPPHPAPMNFHFNDVPDFYAAEFNQPTFESHYEKDLEQLNDQSNIDTNNQQNYNEQNDNQQNLNQQNLNQQNLNQQNLNQQNYNQQNLNQQNHDQQGEIDSKLESVILGLMTTSASQTNNDANVNLIDEIGRRTAEDIKSNAAATEAEPATAVDTTSQNTENTKNLQYGKNYGGKKAGPNGFSSLIVISNTNTNNNLAEGSENQFSGEHITDFLKNHLSKSVEELLQMNITQMLHEHIQKDRKQINDYLKESDYTQNLKANMPTYSVIDNREPTVDASNLNSNSNSSDSLVTLKKHGHKNFERPKDDLSYSYMPYGNGGILVINNANKNRNEKLKRILSGEGVNIVNPSGGIELPLSKEEIEKLLEEAIIVSNENSNSNLLK